MGTNASRIRRWYRANFRGHAFSITQLAVEFEDRDLQRALLNGHITRRIATLVDVRAYVRLPYEKRVAALNAARYASAFNAISPTPVVLALIALCVSFVPKEADTLWVALPVLLGAGMLFVFDQARSLGRAKTWVEMLTDAETRLSSVTTTRHSSTPRTRRAAPTPRPGALAHSLKLKNPH